MILIDLITVIGSRWFATCDVVEMDVFGGVWLSPQELRTVTLFKHIVYKTYSRIKTEIKKN